jgi:nucleotide-binding universal stress UspA family protein
MIKKILVALDPDSDTPVATRYAVEVARRSEAEITGLAVIDMGSIESSIRGGGIGSMYFAGKLQEKLTTEARDKAEELLEEFKKLVEGKNVAFSELVEEGVPFQRIVEDMKYHDMLIVGQSPHFFYSHPKQQTETLAQVVRKTLGPSMLVGNEYREIKKVLLTFDGSDASAEAMRSFVRLAPFGKEVKVRILTIFDGREAEAELMLALASGYLRAHGYKPETLSVESTDVRQAISEQIGSFNADLVVAGAHSRSRIRSLAFGSTTAFLVTQCPVPLFLDS